MLTLRHLVWPPRGQTADGCSVCARAFSRIWKVKSVFIKETLHFSGKKVWGVQIPSVFFSPFLSKEKRTNRGVRSGHCTSQWRREVLCHVNPAGSARESMSLWVRVVIQDYCVLHANMVVIWRLFVILIFLKIGSIKSQDSNDQNVDKYPSLVWAFPVSCESGSE